MPTDMHPTIPEKCGQTWSMASFGLLIYLSQCVTDSIVMGLGWY